MSARRLVAVAVASEGALAVVALVWCWVGGVPLPLGAWASGATAGLAGAAVLATINFVLLRFAPEIWPFTTVRDLYRVVLRPLFADIDLRGIVAVALAAGVGEEIFFRGAVQGQFGWVIAAIVFGLAHVGHRGYVGFGVWAGVIGAGLGWLYRASGGLIAPTVAHAVYDALALAYIRWAPGEQENRP